MSCDCYALETLPRLLDFPLRLELVGWAKNHRMEEARTMVNYNFVCFTFNKTKYDVNMDVEDGRPSLGFIPIGVRVEASQFFHDEIFFGYPPGARDELFKLFRTDRRTSFKLPALNDEVKSIISKIRVKLDELNVPGSADAMDVLAMELICAAVTAQNLEATARKTINMNIYELAYELKRGKRLSELMRKYGFSKQTLYNEWNEAFGESPAQYRIREALKQVKTLLLNTDMPIKEICETCNFSSLIYFYQFFKKHTGLSPIEYRKSGKHVDS